MQEVRKIYQIYIEYIFLLNFVFLYSIWNVSITILSCSVTQKKILLTTLTGAIAMCLCLLLPCMLWYRLVIGAIGTVFFSIRMLFPKKKGYKGNLRYLSVVCMTAVLLGGSIALIQKFGRKSSFSLLQMMGMTLFLSFVIKILLRHFFLTKQTLVYSVTLYWNGMEYGMKGLFDTGNSLVEPISQKAVCIVGKDLFEQIKVKEGERNEFQSRGFRAIPYHSVGKENGILWGYEMDRLIIDTDERKVIIEKPMIGICDAAVGSPQSYQMILNPKLLREGEC